MEHSYHYKGFTLTMNTVEGFVVTTITGPDRQWLNAIHENEGGSQAAEQWVREYIKGEH